MPDKSWKAVERRVASLFGTCRRSLSGGNSKSGGRDDCHHDTLFIEVKHRAASGLVSLYYSTVELANKEGKTPLVALQPKYQKGFLLIFNSRHFLQIIQAWCQANGYRIIKVKKHGSSKLS